MKRHLMTGVKSGAVVGLSTAWWQVPLNTESHMVNHLWRYLSAVTELTLLGILAGAAVGVAVALGIGLMVRLVARFIPPHAERRVWAYGPIAVGASALALLYHGTLAAGVGGQVAAGLKGLAWVMIVFGGWQVVGGSHVASPGPGGLVSVMGALLGGWTFVLVAHVAARKLGARPPLAAIGGTYLSAIGGGLVVAAVVRGATARIVEGLVRRWGPTRASSVVLAALASPVVVVGVIGFATTHRQAPAPGCPVPQGGVPGNVEGPDIILVSVDTLRGDVPGYAGGAARTPHLDRLAAESCVFTRAYSVAPWTRPSFAAFMSGRYPSEMGVGRIRDSEGSGCDAIPYRWRADQDTLAELLRQRGYFTAAVVTNVNLTAQAHVDQGFEAFFECSERPGGVLPSPQLAAHLGGPLFGMPPARRGLERGGPVTGRALEIAARLGHRPALLWVHYMDPHVPYDEGRASGLRQQNQA